MEKKKKKNKGVLYVVASPIGNLKDITLRALEVLKEADIILAEDTRQSKKLLNKLNIQKDNYLACHQHSDEKTFKKILEYLDNGKNLALLTDAGTPGINDPSNTLIEFLLNNDPDIEIVPIPGASALTTLLSVVGKDINPFIYLGFLPHKKGKETILKMIANSPSFNFVFLDNPHRLIKNLKKLKEFLVTDRYIVIGREMTKLHESFYRGYISDLIESLENNKNFLKGETIIFIAKEDKNS